MFAPRLRKRSWRGLEKGKQASRLERCRTRENADVLVKKVAEKGNV